MSIESTEALTSDIYLEEARSNLQSPYIVGKWDTGSRMVNLILLPFPLLIGIFEGAIGLIASLTTFVTGGFYGREVMKNCLWSASQCEGEVLVLLLKALNPKAVIGRYYQLPVSHSLSSQGRWQLNKLRTVLSLYPEALFLRLRSHNNILLRHIGSRLTVVAIGVMMFAEAVLLRGATIPSIIGSFVTLGRYQKLNDFSYQFLTTSSPFAVWSDIFSCWAKIINPWSEKPKPLSPTPKEEPLILIEESEKPLPTEINSL